jgi:hypothetical protein
MRFSISATTPLSLLHSLHNFPQRNFQKALAKPRGEIYRPSQIEPGSLKNFAAQLKEGAAVARPLRPQSFWARNHTPLVLVQAK